MFYCYSLYSPPVPSPRVKSPARPQEKKRERNQLIRDQILDGFCLISITSLDHEIGDDSVELAALVSVRKGIPEISKITIQLIRIDPTELTLHQPACLPAL